MFLSGDNFNMICNLSIYERKYYDRYITSRLENILFINEDNGKLIDSIKSKKNIIFTRVEYLDYFISDILSILEDKFILVTHNSDIESGNNDIILNHKLLINWYGQNMNKNYSLTCGIPIGLSNKVWKNTNFDMIIKNRNNPKTKLLYFNFALSTNPNRRNINDLLIQNGFNKNKNMSWDEYIEDLSKFKFAISPQGNGADCHRTWECLYLGVIPIVIESNEMSFFSDLPILFIKSYDIITENFLEKTYSDFFKNKIFNIEKLKISYWKNVLLYEISKH